MVRLLVVLVDALRADAVGVRVAQCLLTAIRTVEVAVRLATEPVMICGVRACTTGRRRYRCERRGHNRVDDRKGPDCCADDAGATKRVAPGHARPEGTV